MGLFCHYKVLTLHAYNKASNRMRQTLIEMQGEREGSAVRVEYFNIPVLEMERSSGQKISKDVLKSIYQTLDVILSIDHFVQQ